MCLTINHIQHVQNEFLSEKAPCMSCTWQGEICAYVLQRILRCHCHLHSRCYTGFKALLAPWGVWKKHEEILFSTTNNAFATASGVAKSVSVSWNNPLGTQFRKTPFQKTLLTLNGDLRFICHFKTPQLMHLIFCHINARVYRVFTDKFLRHTKINSRAIVI